MLDNIFWELLESTRIISLSGVARLCVVKGYLEANYCYEERKEGNMTKMVPVRNDENLLRLTNNLGSVWNVNLYIDDYHEQFVEACEKMLLEKADDIGRGI